MIPCVDLESLEGEGSLTFALSAVANSNDALDAILSQGRIRQDLPISYASRTLTNLEKNYSTTEKELLAIIWSCTHYRPYLYGRKLTIMTDHKPLSWVFNMKDLSSRLLRWRLKLEEYDYDIVYKRGVRNTNPDALNRITMTRISPVANNSSEPTKEERRKICKNFMNSQQEDIRT